MKRLLIFTLLIGLLSSCGAFGPRPEFYQGMKERKFLRQNKEAVLSNIDGNMKTYRVDRGDRFYVLATFENDRLIGLEEREFVPRWMEGPAIPDNSNR